MKKLKVLALSDLHLGEPEGLLYNGGANIIDTAVTKIVELARGGNGLEDGIEELILVGDIADLSEATENEAYTNTRVFLTALLGKVKVDKIIYIPGNHDHHLWVEMLKAHYGKGSYDECVPKTIVVIPKPKLLIENCIPDSYQGGVEGYLLLTNVEGVTINRIMPQGWHGFPEVGKCLLNKYRLDISTNTSILNEPMTLLEMFVELINKLYIGFNMAPPKKELLEAFLKDEGWLVEKETN